MKNVQKTKEQLLSELQRVQSELAEAQRRLDILKGAAEKRKQTGAAAKQSKDKFYKAFLSSPDMMIITSIPGGKYLEVNESFARNVGYSREELVGHTLDEFNFFDSPAEVERMMSLLQKHGGFKNEEFSFRVRSGELQRWLCSAETVNFNGENCLVSVAADITRSKQMEQALNESQQILSIASKLCSQGIGITTLKEGRFLEVNESQCRLTGYTREEIIGHTALELNLWDNPEDRKRILRKIRAKQRVTNEKIITRTKSGEKHKVLFSAEPINIRGEDCMICSINDITEIEQVELALQVSEDKFTRAFSSSPAAMCIFTVEDSKFTEVNDSYMRFTGYSREEVIGRTADDLNLFVSQVEKDRTVKSLNETGALVNERIQSRMKSGEIRTGLFSGQSLDINNKKHLILTINDITDQIKIVEAIANEAALRRILIHGSRDGIVILDSAGKVYEANRRFGEMLGYSAEEMAGLCVWDWEYLLKPERVKEMIDTVDEAGDHFETKHRRKDGSTYDVEICTNGAIVAGKKLIFCVCRDITQRKLMEQALRESEEKFSKTFHAIPESIVISNVATAEFLDVNDIFCRNTGLSREELIGKTNDQLNIPGRMENRAEMIKTIQEQGRIINREIEIKTKNGATSTKLFSADIINIGGEPCLISLSNDITDRKLMEQTLRESEEKFSKAFLASPQIIAITTEKDGKYIDINENYTQAIGYTREELIGHTARSLHIWVKINDRQDMYRTLEENGRIVEKEYQFRTKTGKIRTWLFSGEPIIIGGEKCLMSVSMDITDRKRIEDQASEAESLREIDKLRRELLANVSHELRTPLSGIKGFTTMLIDYGKRLKSSEKREYLETINNNADQLGALIEQLLEMSRLGAGMLSIKKKPTDVAVLCYDAINEARVRSKDHRFTLDLPKTLPMINLDRLRIHQVLDNLLNNAVKYSDSGTEVNLSVREKNGNLLFTITYHGCGISAEESPNIFQRLFSSRNKLKSGTRGAGLGLPICKGLIEAHDGKIWFKSKDGAGTSFFFTLPIKAKNKPPDSNLHSKLTTLEGN